MKTVDTGQNKRNPGNCEDLSLTAAVPNLAAVHNQFGGGGRIDTHHPFSSVLPQSIFCPEQVNVESFRANQVSHF